MDTEAIITPFDYRQLCQELSAKVNDLEKQFTDKVAENGRNAGLLSRRNTSIAMFEDRLKDALLNEEIDSDLAESFADLFGIFLTQEVEVSYTVTFRGTAHVPLNVVIEDICWEDEVQFDCNSYQSGIEFDLYEDNVEAEVQQ
jgi:hypothetical protein